MCAALYKRLRSSVILLDIAKLRVSTMRHRITPVLRDLIPLLSVSRFVSSANLALHSHLPSQLHMVSTAEIFMYAYFFLCSFSSHDDLLHSFPHKQSQAICCSASLLPLAPLPGNVICARRLKI